MPFSFKQVDLNEAPAELQSLHVHWESLSGDRPGPSLKKFDLLSIPSPLLPNTVVVDYLADNDTFKFRYYGSIIAERHSQEMTGKTPADFRWRPFGEALEKEYRDFLKRGKPEFIVFSFTNEIGVIELHKVLRMPLSEDGKTITGIIAIIISSTESRESKEIFAENSLGSD